ncbi:MAG: flagellar FliJ family protein [Pirellulaceae bacterium]|nr:flagellar FliJ family protein [Pirellulaceae bacterium]
MGLGGILILLLLLVSLIVFIYVLVVSARGWGWLHSILLSFLFIECWVLLIFSAGVHYRRVTATEEAYNHRIAAETELAQTQKLMWGSFNTATSPEEVDAVVPAQSMLRRMTADRGRVWRSLDLLQSVDGTYQLDLSSADAGSAAEGVEADPLAEEPAAAAAPAAPSSESLPTGTIVYGFAEQLNEAEQPIPVYYLGEFAVKESQAGQVTLAPTLELTAAQQQHIASGSATNWTLYELLPLDSHDVFTLPGSQPSDDEAFGTPDEEMVRGLLANVPNDNDQQTEIINSYLRDGKPADDSDPAEDVWVQVNVLKEYKLDVDSREVADATERGFFDASGRSIDTRLKRGDDGLVTLTADSKGKRILLPQAVARPLIDSGVLELVRRVYVRPLIDYEEAFVHAIVRKSEVEAATALAQRDQSEVEKAKQALDEMISFRQIEKQELSSDLGNYQREVKILEEAVAGTVAELAAMRTQIQQLYKNVQAHHASLLGAVSGTALGTDSPVN